AWWSENASEETKRKEQSAQREEGREQPLVITLVQADGRLIQHIHDPNQAGADLARQPDALGFPAGEGLCTCLLYTSP
ncbi:hypothetical protein, partial [Aeromonas salmonicida]|uniref:hypothetical protein n=1 Tax=Aeromonas salmonicida TaxID=645 RepID=UPI003D315968